MSGLTRPGMPIDWRNPDVIDKLKAMGLSAADPFGLPSAGLGLLSPQMRDQWRAGYENKPLDAMLGGLMGAGGAAKMLPQAKTLMGALMQGGTLGAGSDLIDTAQGNGSLDKDTALKAAYGAILSPVKPRIPKGQ